MAARHSGFWRSW